MTLIVLIIGLLFGIRCLVYCYLAGGTKTLSINSIPYLIGEENKL